MKSSENVSITSAIIKKPTVFRWFQEEQNLINSLKFVNIRSQTWRSFCQTMIVCDISTSSKISISLNYKIVWLPRLSFQYQFFNNFSVPFTDSKSPKKPCILLKAFFNKPRYFSTQPRCCLTFSWIGFQIWLRCSLIHISIIILRHFIYLLYLFPYLDVGLFMPYLRDLLFIFFFIFRQVCSFAYFSEYALLSSDDNVNEKSE